MLFSSSTSSCINMHAAPARGGARIKEDEMYQAKLYAIACLLLAAGMVPAQQQGSLGSPAVAPAAPALGPLPTPEAGPSATGPALGPPPTPASPPPGTAPYYLVPGVYPPPYPPPPGYVAVAPAAPIIVGDPAHNPAVWVGIEALLWWTKNQPQPIPLITTGPASEGPNAGNLGQPGTTSLNGPLHFGVTGGMRIYAGAWLDADHTFGLDGSFFFLGRLSAGFGASDRTGTGSIVINTPVNGANFSTQVSAPGYDTGNVSVDATSRLAGGDINVLYNLYRAGGLTINLLGGYRYLELDESLTITANSLMFVTTQYTDAAGNVLVTAPPGSTITVIDHFGTRNQFNGGQVGAQFQYLRDRWIIDTTLKLAIGATHEIINVDGNTTVYPTGGNPVPITGGNYATLQVGRYTQDRFALAPEAQLSVGYQVTPWLRALVGYNFLYLTSVARPGNQIDNTFDGVVHPLVPMVSSGYWAQGLNFTLQFNY
jgi:hypothetical protein